MNIRVIRHTDELWKVRDLWTSWQSHPNAHFDSYVETISSTNSSPYVMVLSQDGQPEAMLIGRIEDCEIRVGLGYMVVARPVVRTLRIMYGGFLGNETSDHCRCFIECILNGLRSGDADVVSFNHVRLDGPLYYAAITGAGFLKRDWVPFINTHRSMTVPQTVEELYSRLSIKVRKNQKWQANRLLKVYDRKVQVKCFTDASDVEQLIHEAESIARQTYQRRLGVGFVDTAAVRQRLFRQAQQGQLCAYMLYLGEQPCAFWIGTLYKGTFHSNYLGYDPKHANYSPGMFLIMKAMEGMCRCSDEQKPRLIDFGFGDAQYKEVLATHTWKEAVCYIYAARFCSIRLKALQTVIGFCDRIGRSAFSRTDILKRVKQTWRRRISSQSAE